MKPIRFIPAIALAALLSTACQKKNTESSNKVAELEKKASEALDRQQELERQLEEQKVASERDALERERMKIEEDRAALERAKENTTEEQAELLRKREQELAARESKADQLRGALEDKESNLNARDQDLTEKERQLAGRDAIGFDVDNNDSAPVGDYGSFYDSLSPYGNWFETSDYGYVWQPLVVNDSTWRPYTRGHWACTDRGWFWISDEPFGWACYHYGRWALCQNYGWVWVPGSEWAPSWVCWRSGSSYVGWAPLPPETLAYRGHRWDATVEVACGIGSLWFNFVNIRDFGNPIQYHCLPYTQNGVYIGNTVNCTNINFYNHRVICGGPFYGDIQRQTARKPPFYRIEEDRGVRPGRDPLAMRPLIRGNQLRVAAPNLDAAWNDSLAPEKVRRRMDTLKIARTEEVKPEIANRFRQSREENQRRADQAVADLGGSSGFFQKRAETLNINQTRIEENRGAVAGRTESGRDIQLGGVSKERAKDLLDRGVHMGRQPTPPPGQAKLRTPDTGNATDPSNSRITQAGELPRVTPPDNRSTQGRIDIAGNDRARVEETRNNPTSRQDSSNPYPLPSQRQDGPQVTPPRGMNRQNQDDDNTNARRQQEEQADRSRQQQQQQQQEVQRQREQARQQQEENRRQQQMEENRREQARQQQQQEESRREQARQQQQQEESRREQARQQQQQEESRREQARQQQQQEENRRQQQQEESRREQARQEQQRQEQQRQDDDRRQRNR